jgi:hypothetical protein
MPLDTVVRVGLARCRLYYNPALFPAAWLATRPVATVIRWLWWSASFITVVSAEVASCRLRV